jgi:RNA polymerase sigma-70 factor, ECF subfamily
MAPLLAHRGSPDRGFERLYRRYAPEVYRYALVILRNNSDAEDVTQTAFLNAYRAYSRGERPRNPKNWLIAIAHNVCRQRFRQAARRPDEVEFNDEVGDLAPEEERGPSAEDIQRALSHLAFNQRAALVMRELEGRSYAEIAEILEVSVSAVETLLFRARRALREQLEGSLTCGQAELAISRELDRRLTRAERGALRAHLRECRECARFARSQRAQRAAFKSLAAVPLPGSLASLFGGGGAAVGGGIALKAAALIATGAVASGVGYQAVRHAPFRHTEAAVAAAPEQQPSADATGAAVTPPQSRDGLVRDETKRAVPAKAKAKATHGKATAPGQTKKVTASEGKARGNTKSHGSSSRGAHLARGHTKASHQSHGATRAHAPAGRSKPKPRAHKKKPAPKKKFAKPSGPPPKPAGGNGGNSGGKGSKSIAPIDRLVPVLPRLPVIR